MNKIYFLQMIFFSHQLNYFFTNQFLFLNLYLNIIYLFYNNNKI